MTGRWTVRRGKAGVVWWAEAPDHITAHHFTTWGEAFAYADQAARRTT